MSRLRRWEISASVSLTLRDPEPEEVDLFLERLRSLRREIGATPAFDQQVAAIERQVAARAADVVRRDRRILSVQHRRRIATIEALRRAGWNFTQAGRALRPMVTGQCVRYRIARFGITREEVFGRALPAASGAELAGAQAGR